MVKLGVDRLCLLLAQTEPAREMPPTTRAIVMMALLAIALLGMLIVVVVLLGGHWVRRQGTHRRGPVVPPDVLLRKDPPFGKPKLQDMDQATSETAITDNTKSS